LIHPLNSVPSVVPGGDEEAILTAKAQQRVRVRSAGVTTVLDVLDALDGRGMLTLSELSRETGAPKSTLHRVCSMMLERGWIARDASTATLGLGPRTAWLARTTPAAALTNGFHSVASALVARHNETTCLVVLDGLDSLFVAKVETTHAVRLVTSVGSRLPAFASAAGRVLLADLSSDRVDAMFADAALITPTGRQLDGLAELHRILARTQELGYGENIDETALGLHCVAVPVGPSRRVAAALTLCVPSGRMTSERLAEMLPDLLTAARSMAPLADAPPIATRRSSAVSVDSASAAGAGSIATERNCTHG
jgi:IclR family transcriptional regulator, KDG regulon repressor